MTELTFRLDYQAGDRRLAAGDEFRAVIGYEVVEEGLSAVEERLDPASESKPQLQRLGGSNLYQVEAMFHGGKDKVLSIGIPAKSLDPDLPSPRPAWGRVSGKISLVVDPEFGTDPPQKHPIAQRFSVKRVLPCETGAEEAALLEVVLVEHGPPASDISDAIVWAGLTLSAKNDNDLVTLTEVVASFDAINHAIPSYDEVSHALNRLNEGGYIRLREADVQVLPASRRTIESVGKGQGSLAERLKTKLPPEPESPYRHPVDPKRLEQAKDAYARSWK